MFNIIYNILLKFFTVFLSILILKIYFGIFFEKRNKNYICYIFWLIYIVWQIIVENINMLPAYMNIVISIIFVSLLCINSYCGSLLQKIVFSVLINAIWMLAEFLVGYIFILYGIDYMIPRSLGSILSKIITLLIIVLLRKFFKNENIKSLSNKYNALLLLIPIGSMFVIYNVFMLSIEQNNRKYVNESVTSLIIVLIINIIIFKLYLLLSKEKELQKYNIVYQQQLELCNQHMIEKENVLMKFRKTRHDIKQHFTVLLEMMDNKENIQAIEYLRKLIDIDPMGKMGIAKTDNVVVDSLINSKYSIATKLKINFNMDIHIPMQLPFMGADISILLGNILDNAIEASEEIEEKERYIKLYMRYERNILIITVINGFNGKLLKNREGKIITQKSDADVHGIGLESVRKVAEKYHGSVVIENRGKEFVIKIILVDIPQKLHATS